MEQLLLNYDWSPAPSIRNFVTGKNQALISTLKNFSKAEERFLYLWGPPGSGKSHLLQAMAREHNGCYVGKNSLKQNLRKCQKGNFYLIDDCQKMDQHSQQKLFQLYDILRQKDGCLIVAGSNHPSKLELRPDLRTRLSWGLSFKLLLLNDDEKANALLAQAKARGLKISLNLIAYLLTHMERDMRTLMELLDRLDRYALSKHRPLTIKLLKEWLTIQTFTKAPLSTSPKTDGDGIKSEKSL